MKKRILIKKVIYIALLTALSLIFIASLTFGAIGAFTTNLKDEIEIWYYTKNEEELSLLSTSIKWLIISATLLILTLSFKEFKKKYID